MCTVTFIAAKKGYLLGMNRDEQRSRPEGLPPERIEERGRTIVCPSEASGGTWISSNDAGVSFSLINWYAISARVDAGAASRGDVVREVRSAESAEACEEILRQLPLGRTNPFRLIGFFPETQCISEWRWELTSLTRQDHRWETQQWISSGFDEPTAQEVRGATFQKMLRQKTSGTRDWLRRLHRSHSPECGPFSTCMHRADAATVSYTEIRVTPFATQMIYISAAPCLCRIPSDTAFSRWRRREMRLFREKNGSVREGAL